MSGTYSINLETTGHEATMAIYRLDKSFVGDTENYMGLATFWSATHKLVMREATPATKKIVHNRIIKRGLSLDGCSREHDAIYQAAYDRTWGRGYNAVDIGAEDRRTRDASWRK
jgi:hypothetical protein